MDAAKEPDPIWVSVDDIFDGVHLLRLNRPKSRNAMSVDMVAQAIAWLELAAHDPAIGAVVIHGEGNGFCAGSDLAGLAAMDDAARAAFEAASGRLARALAVFPRPVIAAVHGFAIGGGLTLAASCDIVFTTPDAKWSLPEVPIGLFPAWGLEAVSQRIGRTKARRLSWGIDLMDGHGAAMLGLADEVADPVLPAALALARRLAKLPRDQSAAVKRYFSEVHEGEGGDREANAFFMASCASEAAVASFVKFGSRQRSGKLSR
ncbi:enoyl-CoA hydratase/isomerase family protein (plasmid) [Sphingobium sp. SJ10-10]|uniref:enoyl-CoA hydratase/isomerase family protein n=1 Tax=Sphingobium sp. SJ10-10 TaxID=3114999 RepID=UPI002E19F9BF|nr:enoyl-CoA hydratase/isomerase family protein [Sphingobium sp. SJ10-10]